MKQTYIKPELKSIVLLEQNQILGSSIDIAAGRYSGGDPVSPSSGPAISGTVDETGGSTDPYTDSEGKPKGQGPGGNRSKTGMIWDEW